MIGRVVAGRFELDRRAGAGGMGTVYRARDLVEGSSVAVKLLSVRDQRNADRFESEAAILAGLSHPAIVRYLSHGLTETGERYLVMEWLDGEDLATRLDREPLAMPDSLALARRIAGALEYVHPRGVVHRDIKPENLFLPEGDISRVKLLDFGIARLGGRAGGPRLTATGSVVGTPGYIAPEMIRGERVVRPAADIFSFGCVLFQCLVGRPPFDSEDTRALMAKILLQDAPRLRDVAPNMPAEVDELLAAMLAKDSDQRISGGAALVEALDRLGGELASVRPAKWRARRVALTTTEQRIVCVVMAACSSPAEPGVEATGAPPASADADPTRPSIRVDAIVDDAAANVAATIVTDTVPDPEADARSTGLRRIEAHLDGVHGAQVDYLPDGTLLVSFTETAKPSDQAARAARSALAIRAALPDTPIVVATGPGRFSGAADHHRTEIVDLASVAPLSKTRSGPRGRLMVGDVIENGSRLLRATAPGSIRIDDMTAGFLDGRFEIQREELAFYLRGERDLFEQQRSLLGRSTEFVGRGRELSFLTNLIASVSAECQAAAMLVTGAAGVGKSRLRREFLEWVQRQSRRIEVLFAAGDSLAAGSPFAMLGQALRRSAGIREDQSLEEKRSRFEKRIARHIPPESRRRITSFLGELARISYPDENLSALGAARGNPQLMSDGIRRAFEDFLAAECNAQPVLLVLEDLHWGDLGTVTLVDGALRALSEQPLMVLALARPEVDATFPDLWREREPQHMRLAPLSRKAAERLVREALGAEATADDVARIVSRADGNAFFLEELVRAHAAGRGGELPDSVLGMVQARLDAEGASAKRVLRAASVFGERFTRAGVLALLGGGSDGDPDEGDSQSDITDWLGRLCDRELISRPPTPVPGTDVDYTFAHALVREAAYAMLTAEDRRLGHRLAGDYLEQVGGQAGADPMILAEHFQRAEEPGRAIRWYQHAAEQALSANDLGAAVKRAELGIACGADGLRAGLLRSVQAEAHLWRGELSLAESRALEAVALLQPGTAPWLRAQGQVVVAAAKQGNFDRVELQTREVIHTLPEFGARNAEIACLAWAANFLIFGGRTAAADELMITIGDLAGDLSDLDAEAVALVRQVRSARALAAGDLAGCLTELSIALLWFERASDLRNACAIRSNMAYVSAELGDLESAEAALRQALIAADRMGLRDVTAHVRHNLGRVLGLQGQLTEAAAVEAEAVKSFAAQGDPRLEGVARAYHAEILLASGDLAAAAAEARAAVGMLEVSPSLRVAALAVFARVRMASGETAEALATAREAFEALARLGEIEEGEALVRLTYAECLEAAGFLDEARGVILAARARLLERASHIGEPDWRERFLRDVPANARTFALADQILTTSSGPLAHAI